MKSGTIEGSILLPLLFILYINDLIKSLRLERLGCCVGNIYCGCLLFAADILLMSTSIQKLQFMLNIFHEYCVEWDLKFNVKKSNVMVVGANEGGILPTIQLGMEDLNWVTEIKCLGVMLFSKKGLRVYVDYNCRKFLGTSLSILQNCGNMSEHAPCEIILTKYLPILTYGLECFKLLEYEKRHITVAFNTVIRRIFKLSKHTSVRHVLHCLGSKPEKNLNDERRCLLLSSCISSSCSVIKSLSALLVFSDYYYMTCVQGTLSALCTIIVR